MTENRDTFQQACFYCSSTDDLLHSTAFIQYPIICMAHVYIIMLMLRKIKFTITIKTKSNIPWTMGNKEFECYDNNSIFKARYYRY